MSKLNKVETSRMKKLLASIPIMFILILGILSILPISLVTHAANPSLTADGTGGTTAAGSSFMQAAAGAFNTRGGYTEFVIIGENTANAAVSSITDSLSCTTWGKAFRAVTPTDASFSGNAMEIWYGIVPNGGCSGTPTLTINFSPSFTWVSVELAYSAASLGFVNWYTAGGSCATKTCPQVAPLFPTIAANSLVIGLALGSNMITATSTNGAFNPSGGATCYSNGWDYSAPTPVAFFDQYAIETSLGFSQSFYCVYGNTYPFLQMGFVYYTSTTAMAIDSSYYMGNGNQQADGNYFVFEDALGVFSGSGIVPPSCSGASCQVTNGGSIISTSTSAVISNRTFIYTGTSPSSTQLLIQNVSTKIASVTAQSTGDKITLALYEAYSPCPTGHTCGGYTIGSIVAQGNTLAISGGNPLREVAFYTWVLTTTATPFYLHWQTTIAILNGTTWAVVLSTAHNGITIYQSTIGGMYVDTSDGYNPSMIQSFSASSPPYYFFASGTIIPRISNIIGSAATTITTTVGSTTVTATTTSYLATLQGSQGAVAITSNLISYLPLWVLPLILGAWFGLIGLFIGLILGLGFGTLFGLIPLWLGFLLGLGMLFLMSRLH